MALTSKYKHVMVDIETMGHNSNAPVLSIGAVEFDPFSQVLDENEFYEAVDFESALTIGRPDGSTMKWWMQQGEAARKAITMDGQPDIASVLADFHEWYQASRFTHFWCYGANFDEVILRNAFAEFEMTPPWGYRDVRCARTLLAITGQPKTKGGGVEHVALDDAKQHARDVQVVFQKLFPALIDIPVNSGT